MEQKTELLKKCDICATFAKNLCLECLNYYCDSCYKFVHDKENNSKHKKDQIDPYVPIDIKCPLHSRSPLNLYCIEDKGNN